MLLLVHCSSDGLTMILLVLCSGFLQILLNLSEIKLPPASDINFFGKPYSEKLILCVGIGLSAGRSSVFLMTGNLLGKSKIQRQYLLCIFYVLDTMSPKNGTNVHLKWQLSLFSFRFTCLHICSTFHSVLLWSFPLLS